jgi:hypothetical protein
MTSPPTTDRRISEWDLRRLFNEGGFAERTKTLTTNPDYYSKPVAPDKAKELKNVKPRAKSETIRYRDSNGQLVVEVHHYLNEDGSLGAAGRDDPKTIVIKGITYHKPRKHHAKPKRLTSREINEILDKDGLAATLTYIRTGWLRIRHLLFIVFRR